jgi:hypothetical protein
MVKYIAQKRETHPHMNTTNNTHHRMRRACRAILRLHEIFHDAGDCFTASTSLASHLMTDVSWVSRARVRQEWISLNGSDTVMWHAWVEALLKDGTAWTIDPTAHQMNEHVPGIHKPGMEIVLLEKVEFV